MAVDPFHRLRHGNTLARYLDLKLRRIGVIPQIPVTPMSVFDAPWNGVGEIGLLLGNSVLSLESISGSLRRSGGLPLSGCSPSAAVVARLACSSAFAVWFRSRARSGGAC